MLKILRTVTDGSYSIQAVLPRLQQYTAVYINTLQQFSYLNALIAVSIFVFCSLLEINFNFNSNREIITWNENSIFKINNESTK